MAKSETGSPSNRGPRKQTPDKTTHQPPPRYGLQSAARAVTRIAQPMWRKRGFAESRVITNWPEIVGETLAPHCVPERISPPRAGAAGSTLYVRVAGTWAVELHHLSPQILDRVNSFLGFQAVSELRLTQGPVVGKRRRPKPVPLPPEAKTHIRETVDRVGDDDLRDALVRLGEALHTRPQGSGQRRNNNRPAPRRR